MSAGTWPRAASSLRKRWTLTCDEKQQQLPLLQGENEMLWGHLSGHPTLSRGVRVSFTNGWYLNSTGRGWGIPEQGPGGTGRGHKAGNLSRRPVSPIRLHLESDGDPESRVKARSSMKIWHLESSFEYMKGLRQETGGRSFWEVVAAPARDMECDGMGKSYVCQGHPR